MDTEGDSGLHRREVHQLLIMLERWEDVQRTHPQIQVGRREEWGASSGWEEGLGTSWGSLPTAAVGDGLCLEM